MPLRILVVVPTTGGPILIKSLRPRAGLPASAAFAEGDYRPLPWSADYARLTAAEGPLSGLLPAAALTPHELRLTRSFDTGRSWEVPVCLAHALIAAGHRLVRDPAEAELILWATGAVDLDLRPIPGAYALLDKLERSRDLLDSAPGTALAVLLPPGDERAEAERTVADLGRKAAPILLPQTGIAEAAAALARGFGDSESSPPEAGRPGRRAIPAALLAALTLAAAGAAILAAVPGRRPPDEAPAATEPSKPTPAQTVPALPREQPSGVPAQAGAEGPGPEQAPPPLPLVVEELHAPPGSSCRRVLFGADPPERRTVAREASDRLRASHTSTRFCGLAFAGRSGARVTVGSELRAATVPPVGLPDGTQAFYLRENAPRNIVYRIQVQFEGRESGLTHAIAP
ncbi:hypothetical protein [Methylorubrum extorquens]|uniref:hypothetical protein n=1 Tax=Methylorubrum extorquens TaxID=408 RepID=UPI0011BD6701|nr:hypothetical protein [Methylorubrum extorquens]